MTETWISGVHIYLLGSENYHKCKYLFIFIFAYLIDLAEKGELTHIVNELLIVCNMHRYADFKMMKFTLVYLTFGDDIIR